MLLALILLASGENPELLRARALYGEMKYEAAQKALVKAITSPGLTPADRADIYLYTGLCRHQAGDEAGALSAFREALTIDRTLELPSGVSPKTRRTFEKARAELPPIETTPPPPPPQVEQPVVVTPPPQPAPPQPAPQLVEEPPPPPAKTKHWWPSVASWVLAAGSLGTAVYMGTSAQSTATLATMSPWGSDGFALSQQAHTYATVANVLYIVGGVLAAFGILAAIVF
jgi:hypothetical protein